ncbi:2-alkenal reductase (NADP(+)-dependent)-like [Rhizophagus clarus]|uniref:2-alkenal reductase (NADP(+)-dependent)-like n=1 Tax=Rhizophagus clarus TaxID=94130 RepID=A0A8H3QB19_9GLOM|nr:2-alkenal reductase (NADP(+)-dependent)-like [Rhizophagus clarus]
MPEIDENFELTHRIIDIENLNLDENEFVLRNLYLSIDPYVRFGVSEVIKTHNLNYKIGDLVYILAWEEYSHIKSDAASTFSLVNKKSLRDTPLSYHALSVFQYL